MLKRIYDLKDDPDVQQALRTLASSEHKHKDFKVTLDGDPANVIPFPSEIKEREQKMVGVKVEETAHPESKPVSVMKSTSRTKNRTARYAGPGRRARQRPAGYQRYGKMVKFRRSSYRRRRPVFSRFYRRRR